VQYLALKSKDSTLTQLVRLSQLQLHFVMVAKIC
jgi:hypothetical protein